MPVVRGRGSATFRRTPVNGAGQQLLKSFDALPEADKHRAAVEILRRALPAAEGDLPESALI